MLLAAILGGLVKVFSSMARSAAVAYCSTKELWYLNGFTWLTVALAVAGGIFGARWGIAGVIYGVSVGWLARGVLSAWFAIPYFRVSSANDP